MALFPGQGSQYPGMGRSLFANSQTAMRLFEEADDVLGFSLSKLMFEGPKEELKKTAIAQPAILLHSVACFQVAQESLHADIKMAIGHSLGEYSALVAASVIDFSQAIKAVWHRGRYMQEAVPQGQGAMAAVLGLDLAAIEEICHGLSQKSAQHYVCAANMNGPLQTVISGTLQGVQEASDACLRKGAKRVIPLEVSAPFHCALMKPVQQSMAPVLEQIDFRDAHFPIITNVSAQPVSNGSALRKLLIEQIISPVRFTESIQYMKEHLFPILTIEFGPQRTLSGLASRMVKEMSCYSVDEFADIQLVLERMNQ